MQDKVKKFIIYLATAFMAAFAGYALTETYPGFNARHYRLSDLQELVNQREQRTDSILRCQQDVGSELAYYLLRHRPSDEGFSMIANYNSLNDSIIRALKEQQLNTIRRHDPRPLPSINTIDSTGYYSGMTDDEGLPHGFGFFIKPFKDMQVGTWVHGKYKGERLQFTPERIYGIDIARYQHEKGKRKFGINWNALRITHLGKHNQQNVKGEADYPVSFIYIKATQGTTVTNNYYAADYKAAHKHGYHVGAYHFYSTTSGAREQARHFLKTAKFSTGDFPPVFDVEPSDAQIKAMGGKDKMLNEMRTWLKVVEEAVGIKPIIYVNQSFVNKYLADAPDLKRGYFIWIARYSEYKPDVKICWWQLSATGRVRGIQSEVDINVFNGYSDQWEDFLSHELIP